MNHSSSTNENSTDSTVWKLTLDELEGRQLKFHLPVGKFHKNVKWAVETTENSGSRQLKFHLPVGKFHKNVKWAVETTADI